MDEDIRFRIFGINSIKCTHPFVADELLVADGLVGLELGGGAGGSEAVAEGLRPAAVVIPTLVPQLEGALVGATGTLERKLNRGYS